MNPILSFRAAHARMTFNTIAGVALAIAGASSALGVESTQVRNGTVKLTDLNLSRPSEVAIARERVHQMARKLCAQIEHLNSISHQVDFVACVDSAMATAEPRLEQLAANASTGERVAKVQR